MFILHTKKKGNDNMCKICNDPNCLLGERCGNLEESELLIEDGTMAAFNQDTFDSKIKKDK